MTKIRILKRFTLYTKHNRAVGTRISYNLYKKFGNNNLEKDTVAINFTGSAGQSFGAFGIKGLKLNLTGDANDYVAKGLSGATISIKLKEESNYNIKSKHNHWKYCSLWSNIWKTFCMLDKLERGLL